MPSQETGEGLLGTVRGLFSLLWQSSVSGGEHGLITAPAGSGDNGSLIDPNGNRLTGDNGSLIDPNGG
jgi:hypothetical protein